MSIGYTIPYEIFAILKKWDWLGFDGKTGSAEAILTHEDWAERWDLSEATLDDLEAVGKWREETLSANQVNTVI